MSSCTCVQASLHSVFDTASWAAAVMAVEDKVAPLLPAKERAVAAADAALQQHGLCHSEVPVAFSLASIPLAGFDSIVFLLERSGLAIKFFTDEVCGQSVYCWAVCVGGQHRVPAGEEWPRHQVLHG